MIDRVFSRSSELLGSVKRNQNGITGLETAIVLITFVMFSMIFSFAVLSTGLFASEETKDAAKSGLSEVQASLEAGGSIATNITFTVVAGETKRGDGSTTTFSLVHGPVIVGSVTVKVDEDDDGSFADETAKVEGTEYTVSYDTEPGVITFVVAPPLERVDDNIEFAYTHYSVEIAMF